MSELLTTQTAYEQMREFFSRPDAVLARNSVAEFGCVYRGNNDPKSPIRCAFGCLLADEHYDPEMEGKTVTGVFASWPALCSLFGDVRLGFLSRAQACHDSEASHPADFVLRLDGLAADFGLEVVK